MSDKYVQDAQGNPVRCDDLMQWAASFEQAASRTIARDEIGEVLISTVFLGLDHSFHGGPPVLWETMIFGGALDQEQERYTSRAHALTGHAAMVARVRAASTRAPR
jgi:hypothetical protein